VAIEALERIAGLYAVENDIRGRAPEAEISNVGKTE
jgi:hypothetical protein